MRRYIVVAHKTLGGAHLMEHLHRLREQDPYCTFHLIVPQHHPFSGWDDHLALARGREVLDEMLDRLASMRIGATGEVGDANPVAAVNNAVLREGRHAFAGVIVSTLPKGISRWWLFDVPKRMANEFRWLTITHLVADEALATTE